MGTQRTSNKDILEAIASQTTAINALVSAISGTVATPAQTQAPAPVNETAASPDIQVKKSYSNHMVAKVTDKVNEDGASRALYARRNGNGETKLAYCLLSRLDDVKVRDRGYLGTLQIIEPSA